MQTLDKAVKACHAKNERSSLLRKFVNYELKKFYSPWCFEMLWTLDSIVTAWHESASVEATNGKSSNGRSVVGRDVGEAQDGRGERGQRGRSGTFLFLQK